VDAIARVMRAEGADGAVVHQAVFLTDGESSAACRQIMRELYGDNIPATSYIPQPPCEGALLAIEALGLGRGQNAVDIQRFSDQVVVARDTDGVWVYAANAVPRTSAAGVYEKTICSYQHLLRMLPAGGARLGQVLRTWLYLGGIIDDDGPTQRYKELNRARAELYQGVPFAATPSPSRPDSRTSGQHRGADLGRQPEQARSPRQGDDPGGRGGGPSLHQEARRLRQGPGSVPATTG
jgi:hypothetical protein